jgi:hypothetical protein
MAKQKLSIGKSTGNETGREFKQSWKQALEEAQEDMLYAEGDAFAWQEEEIEDNLQQYLEENKK